MKRTLWPSNIDRCLTGLVIGQQPFVYIDYPDHGLTQGISKNCPSPAQRLVESAHRPSASTKGS
ncbi:MAG: hypothetical protein AAGA46_11120 [Cyanobacteria bacterium P01_F01_bin.13]